MESKGSGSGSRRNVNNGNNGAFSVIDSSNGHQLGQVGNMEQAGAGVGDHGGDQDKNNGVIGGILALMSWLIIILTFPLSLLISFRVVQEYERAIIYRLGRLHSGNKRGIYFVLPCIETSFKVDLRCTCFDVPPQEILTKDSVTVSVDAVVYIRVIDAVASIANVQNAQLSTRLLAQTTLRNVLGTKNLHEVLGEGQIIADLIQNALNGTTEIWGIKVERVEIKDVKLAVQLQRAMAAEAEATREGRAKLIAAQGEHKASRALKEAAVILSQSPVALKLRYLQTLQTMCTETQSTIIFPLPIDVTMSQMNAYMEANRRN